MVTVPPRFGVCAGDAAGRAMESTAAPARPSPPRTRSSRRFKDGRRACRPGSSHDARAAAVDEERLPAGHGMRADDRVLRLRKDLALVLHTVAAAVDVLALVHGREVL